MLTTAMLVVACSSPRGTEPPVREIYRTAAQRQTRNPVVVIHGILGSRLEQRSTGKTVWGAFTSDAIDPETADGARALGLPMAPADGPRPYDPTAADVFASGPLRAIQLGLLFTVINVQVYADILRSLGVGGYRDPVLVDPGTPAYAQDHYTCYTFFYDWRRDNIENAALFGRYLRDLRVDIERRARRRLEFLRTRPDATSATEAGELAQWLADGFRFDIVAHSMGGLIARWFLQFGDADLPSDGSVPPVTWAGAREIDRLILVGTPNLGAMESLQTLTQGFAPGLFLPEYHHGLLGSLPSIYQLLPRNGQGLLRDERGAPADVDLYDVATWDQNGWGLLDPAAARYLEWLQPDEHDPARRRQQARARLAWCLQRARGFHAALDQQPPSAPPTEIRLFAADTIPTLARARLVPADGGRRRLLFDGDGTREPGDGTVPRFSTIADRRVGQAGGGWLDSPVPWSSVTFLSDDHIGLTKNPLFTNNLLFFLLEQRPPRRG
ncbi:MAG: hypothetical protein IPK26_18380 [Planctomycetes bacterium]|nr:hypothetical protein [Planctomycetota bacterium]